MELKIYQENAIKEILIKSVKLLSYSGEKKMIFRSPTGSGKTIMMADCLKQIVKNCELKQPLSFIWTAPRQLHIQSKNKLEGYFQDTKELKCSFFEDLDDRRMDENEILFFNWESINKSDNIYIRENERNNNLSNVLERTKQEGREIVLVIDECHHHATSEISKKLIDDISPKLTIEVSATPIAGSPDESVAVQIEDVKAEGMIKKAVLLNPEFENVIRNRKIESKLSQGSEELVIQTALKKRQELLERYIIAKSNINPLVLVQLPDRKTSLEDVIKEKVVSILENQYNIITKNGKLAIHLSGHHENLENIAKSDNEAEVLIFKHALALGWDCPRAQILVLFRDWKSVVFSIQTVGRIMRMPEPLKGHYEIDDLNFGYVYTNLADIEIHEDIAKNYITVYTSKRRHDYKSIDLVSCSRKRYREKTRLSSLFIEIFLKAAEDSKLKEKIDVKSRKITEDIISDWKMEDIDLKNTGIIRDKRIEYELDSFDLQRLFDHFVRQNLSPFYPEDRSIGRVKEAIYRFYAQELMMNYEKLQDDIIKATLSDENIVYFLDIISKAKEIYMQEVSKREKELSFNDKWNIPKQITYNMNFIKEDKQKSVLQPFYEDVRATRIWQTERGFINFLERSKNIEWWFKNGERDATYFAVSYEENDEYKPFYVDFVVMFKDGRIGLFDTKSGITAQVAGAKSNGLQKYVKEQNTLGKNLWGGIAIFSDGVWRYYEREKYHYDPKEVTNWSLLEL